MAAKPSLVVDTPAELWLRNRPPASPCPLCSFLVSLHRLRTATDSSTGLVGQQAQAAQLPAAGAA